MAGEAKFKSGIRKYNRTSSGQRAFQAYDQIRAGAEQIVNSPEYGFSNATAEQKNFLTVALTTDAINGDFDNLSGNAFNAIADDLSAHARNRGILSGTRSARGSNRNRAGAY